MSKFTYLDISTIESGWYELHRDVPNWIAELRKSKYEPLKKDAELDLIRIAKYSSGKESIQAKETVLSRNLRFVANIVRHYLHSDVATTDLISAGNEALVEAFNKFDPERDVKFITYAVNHVRASMIEVLRKKSVITLSVRATQLVNDYMKYGDIATMKLHFPERYESSIEKLEDKLDKYLAIKYLGSLEDPVKQTEPVVFTYGDEIRQILDKEDLTSTEKEIITLNFGLEDEPPLGLRKIADKLNSNLSKVAKIRNVAFAKITEQ